MALPILTFSPIAMRSTALNLTAVTGGSVGTGPSAGFNVVAPLAGSTGAAWMCPCFDTTLHKGGARMMLAPTFFGTKGANGNAGAPAWLQTYQLDDEENAYGHGGGDGPSDMQNIDGGFTSWNFTGSNCGVQWSLLADQRLRLFTAYLYTDGGNWQVEATLSDGSATSVPLNLGGASGVYPNASFTVAYRARDAGSTLLLKIRNPTNSVGATSALLNRAYFIGVPTNPASPRGMNRIKTYSDLFGGTN